MILDITIRICACLLTAIAIATMLDVLFSVDYWLRNKIKQKNKQKTNEKQTKNEEDKG